MHSGNVIIIRFISLVRGKFFVKCPRRAEMGFSSFTRIVVRKLQHNGRVRQQQLEG